MVWHLSLDRHRESILVAFADLLTSPASRRELAHSDIAGMYRMLCDAGISQASMQRARNSCESAHDEQRPCKHFASSDAAWCGMTEGKKAAADLWGSADYSGLAKRLEPAADALIDAAAPQPGEHVLDAAAGTGNVAIRAVGRGAKVTAVDIAPRMVQLGRERTGPAVE